MLCICEARLGHMTLSTPYLLKVDACIDIMYVLKLYGLSHCDCTRLLMCPTFILHIALYGCIACIRPFAMLSYRSLYMYRTCRCWMYFKHCLKMVVGTLRAHEFPLAASHNYWDFVDVDVAMLTLTLQCFKHIPLTQALYCCS